MHYPIKILGTVITGSGRGRTLGTPTINIDPACAGQELQSGVYASFVTIEGKRLMGALHYGLRPVFKDSLSLEVHVLDRVITAVPASVEIDVIGRIRDVQNFASKEELMDRIQEDITVVRGMLRSA